MNKRGFLALAAASTLIFASFCVCNVQNGENEGLKTEDEVNEPKVIHQAISYTGRYLKHEPNGDGTCKITGWNYLYEHPAKVVIPEVLYNGLVVTEIGAFGFYSSDIKEIVIPDTVKIIAANAFNQTGYYENKDNWEDSVLYIGKHLIEAKVFAGSDVTVKEGTLTLAGYSFGRCRGLKAINLPSSLQGIGNEALANCDGLTEINFGGTKEMWYAIKKGNEWNYNTGEYTVHCTDGDILKTDS